MPARGPDEALVKVARAGICHTDVIIRAGQASHVRYPVIPGHEFSGVVHKVGPAVRYIKPGDRVAVHSILGCAQCTSCRKGDVLMCEHYDELGAKRDGGFSEFCAVPAIHLHRLPDNVSLEEAAMIEPLANACSALRQADIKFGERVVVIGPGPIGLMALQAARFFNPSLLVLVGTRDERLAVGKQLVPEVHTVNVKKGKGPEELKEVLEGNGADVLIDCAGTPGAWQLLMDNAAFRARICIEGAYGVGEKIPIEPYSFLLCRAVTMMGVCGWVTRDFVQALDLVARDMVNLKALHTHTFPLDQWEAGFDMTTNRKSESLKVELACD